MRKWNTRQYQISKYTMRKINTIVKMSAPNPIYPIMLSIFVQRLFYGR